MGLKILFVINGLGTGGSERSLAEMLPYLVQMDIKPIITCLYRRTEGIEKQVLAQGYRVHFLSGQHLLSKINALRHLIHIERPDLIHTTIFESNLSGRLAAIGISVPVISSLVNIPYPQIRLQDPNISRVKFRLAQLIDALTARYLTRHIHAVSEAVRQAAITNLRLPPERITVIERGRDPRRLGIASAERRAQVRGHLDLPTEAQVIVNVGRHEYQKGQRHLIEAMAIVTQSHPDAKLLIAGRSGHATAELESTRSRLGLKNQVQLLGHRDDIPDILAAADLFAFPSLYEGMPGAIIEAMALGLPIVASDIAPVREVVEVGRNGLLIQPNSPEAMATAVETLLNDVPRAAAFGRRSREIFEQQFTLDQSAARMVELYYRLAQ